MAATVLLGELATRSTSAPPQSHADLGVASRLAALEKVVGTMAASFETLKGVVSDHEVAILDMEHDLLKVRPKPGEERWPPWAEAGKTEPADDEVEKCLSGLQANQFEPPIKEPELEPGLQGMAGLIAEADEVLQEVVAPPPPPSAIELIESLCINGPPQPFQYVPASSLTQQMFPQAFDADAARIQAGYDRAAAATHVRRLSKLWEEAVSEILTDVEVDGSGGFKLSSVVVEPSPASASSSGANINPDDSKGRLASFFPAPCERKDDLPIAELPRDQIDLPTYGHASSFPAPCEWKDDLAATEIPRDHVDSTNRLASSCPAPCERTDDLPATECEETPKQFWEDASDSSSSGGEQPRVAAGVHFPIDPFFTLRGRLNFVVLYQQVLGFSKTQGKVGKKILTRLKADSANEETKQQAADFIKKHLGAHASDTWAQLQDYVDQLPYVVPDQ